VTFRVLLPTTVLVAAAVAIFERIAGAWTRTALLTASDAATADVLGEYVSLDGDLLLAGAANEGLLDPAAPWTGAGYLFRRGPDGWTQERKFLPPDPIEFHEFGLAGDVDGDLITIGAKGTDHPSGGADRGSAEPGPRWPSSPRRRA
jgi:hypothetical protein